MPRVEVRVLLPAPIPVAETVAMAATPSPAATTPPDSLVTPQPVGFFATLIVGILVALLGIDLVRRIRRVNYRAQIREQLEAEQAELAEIAKEQGTGGESKP